MIIINMFNRVIFSDNSKQISMTSDEDEQWTPVLVPHVDLSISHREDTKQQTPDVVLKSRIYQSPLLELQVSRPCLYSAKLAAYLSPARTVHFKSAISQKYPRQDTTSVHMRTKHV